MLKCLSSFLVHNIRVNTKKYMSKKIWLFFNVNYSWLCLQCIDLYDNREADLTMKINDKLFGRDWTLMVLTGVSVSSAGIYILRKEDNLRVLL